MADKTNGYVGRIKNQGTQAVKAPYGSRDSAKGTVKITGNDLRNGSRKGKK